MAKLEFDRVTVRYPIYNARAMSVRNHLVRLSTGGRIGAEAGNVVTVTALQDVSFSLKDGDFVGLVGHNGAGKSTLLRTMAGIYVPLSGQITRQGSVGSVFELGAGMDPELSGYDNVIRVMMLLGRSKKEAAEHFAEVADFTELGDYLNLPIRTYSAGMMTRLMFAVSTMSLPAILLIDEVFGTGDAAFQEKAKKRMESMMETAKILVFASHDMGLVKRFCNRIFKLDHGSIAEIPMEEI